MIPVRVAGVAIDGRGQHVVLLAPTEDADDSGRVLPIWIGAQESTSILVAIEGSRPPRPLAHDLMASLLETVDTHVDRVEVTRLEEGTYYAELHLETPEGSRVIDCRPSDAIALASRLGAPLLVAEAVLEEAGIPEDVLEGAESGFGGGGSDDAMPTEAELEAALREAAAPDSTERVVAAGDSAVPEAEVERGVEEFRAFLEGIDPEDFRG